MYNVDKTVDHVIDALAIFIQPFVGEAQIIRAQVNRVPMPKFECVILTELFQIDLETPSVYFKQDGDLNRFSNSKRIDVQIDFYGEKSGDWCAAVNNCFKTSYATDVFPAGIQPLYLSDSRQTPMIGGEEQYVQRWTVTASIQYNPNVDLPQDSADKLSLNFIEAIDVTNQI